MTDGITWRCQVDGCERPKDRKAAKGKCGYHYEQEAKHRRPLRECAAPNCAKMARRPLCPTHRRLRWQAVEDAPRCTALSCEKRALRADGYCETHYQRVAKYGVTPETFDRLLAAQGGGCAICEITEAESPHALVVDHDHACCPGKRSCGACVRGILCRACNVGIGNLRDDAALVEAALTYLNLNRQY